MSRAALVLLALAAGAAHAGVPTTVWERALDKDVTAARDRYAGALAEGDDLAVRANARGQSRTAVVTLIDQALAAYRTAAGLQPTEAEPYWRIASVLENYFTDCESTAFGAAVPITCVPKGSAINLGRARAAVEAYDAFEQRAPLDPRSTELLFRRAILRTKLVDGAKDPRPLLEGALADYRAMIDRAGGLYDPGLEQVWGNLAETYMMIGRLEEAIDTYRRALRTTGDTSTAYGLAVALDRDGNEAEAVRIIRSQPIEEFRRYQYRYAEGAVFYVPRGEEFYYFALVYEAHGYATEAIGNWRLFLQSGAHPQYQARAKAHLDALLKTRPARQLPSPDVFDLWP